MNTILYIRQSKDSKNAEESLAGQEFECREAAENTPGMEITQVLRDTVRGTLTIAEREAGRVLLSAIRERECEAILLPSVDRLSRDTWGEQDLQLLIDLLKGSGILWYFSDNRLLGGELIPFDYEDDTQILAVKTQLAASALERISITKRTMRKKRAMLANQELMLTGSPPFGYFEEKHIEGNKVMRQWNIEPAQALIVKRIFDLYTSGTQVKELAKVLNSEGTISPGARDWNTTALYRILNHEIYKGTFVWGKYNYDKKNSTKVLRKVGEPGRFDIPREDFRIVSDDTWERAQIIAKDNKTVRTPKEFLLRGHLVCECGESMIGNGNYYRCKSSKRGKKYNCGNGSLRKDEIEWFAWGVVKGIVYNPEDLYKAVSETIIGENGIRTETEARAQELSKQIAAKNRELGNLGYSISKAEGERMIDTLLKQSAIMEQELNLLEQELSTLRDLLDSTPTDAEERIEQVEQVFSEFTEDLEQADYNYKRQILHGVGVKVTHTRDKRILVSIGGVS